MGSSYLTSLSLSFFIGKRGMDRLKAGHRLENTSKVPSLPVCSRPGFSQRTLAKLLVKIRYTVWFSDSVLPSTNSAAFLQPSHPEDSRHYLDWKARKNWSQHTSWPVCFLSQTARILQFNQLPSFPWLLGSSKKITRSLNELRFFMYLHPFLSFCPFNHIEIFYCKYP